MKHQYALIKAMKVLLGSDRLRLQFLMWLAQHTLDPVQMDTLVEQVGVVDIEPMLELAEKAESSYADLRI